MFSEFAPLVIIWYGGVRECARMQWELSCSFIVSSHKAITLPDSNFRLCVCVCKIIIIMCIIYTVSPDAIHEHVKTKIEGQETKRLHYTAPEYAMVGSVQTSADIYAFGICALEVLIFQC